VLQDSAPAFVFVVAPPGDGSPHGGSAKAARPGLRAHSAHEHVHRQDERRGFSAVPHATTWPSIVSTAASCLAWGRNVVKFSKSV
jgi:hypothetical protein